MSNEIESLRNLGPKSGEWLRSVGICTVGDLERVGAVAAYRMVKKRHAKISLNLLWAIEAGLQGKDWRQLSDATKNRLRHEIC